MPILPNVFQKKKKNELNVFRPKSQVNILDELDKNLVYISLYSNTDNDLITAIDEDIYVDPNVPYTLYYADAWNVYYQEQGFHIKSFIIENEGTILLTVKKD